MFAATAMAQVHLIEGPRIRGHVKFLSDDLLEGRGVGQRGGQQMMAAGLKPAGDNGSYRQMVPLRSVEVAPGMELAAASGGQSVRLRWLDDFVGTSHAQAPKAEFDAPAVFVGHGIVAPEYGWNDYAGADVKGKVVVLFTGEPPSDDPAFFKGKALTYYGRWTYKYEEAARQGALAAVIIHTTPTASYGWQVLRANGRPQPQIRRDPARNALTWAGWVTTEAGGKILAMAGKDVDGALKVADTKGFKPQALGNVRFKGKFSFTLKEIETHNVAGMVEGSDPVLGKEAVVFSAHWDHLGVGEALNGDSIYNGAVDNATGCGMLLEMARAWAAMEPKPRRSAIFVAVTAEESGLIGSQYFAEHSPVPAGKLMANLNFDSYSPYGKVRDIVVSGSERTTLRPVVESVTERFGLTIKPDGHPEAGSYYRSDHFCFARMGVPAFSVGMGSDYVGKPAGFAAEKGKQAASTYHQPTDEYKEDWDFSGMEQFARFGMTLGLEFANLEKMAGWVEGDEFLPARDKALAAAR
jgi:Zn-dependent M28 family amino/carboxypeptidase